MKLHFVAITSLLLTATCIYPLRVKYPCTLSDISPIDTVHIDGQVWMVKNLDVCTFRNGDTIAEAASLDEWIKAYGNGIPAWCYYNNDSSLGRIFGKLYNWPAVIDSRGLAPIGFRIPDRDDFLKLLNFVRVGTNNSFEAESKLLDKKHFEWGNNSSGFSALPAGIRVVSSMWIPPDTLNRFVDLNASTGFWTSESCSYDRKYIWAFFVNIEPDAEVYGTDKRSGLSVRCIKIKE